jgi:Ca2+-transporting ATPase
MEPKEEDVMYQPPRKVGEGIINRDIMLNVIFVGVVMTLGVIGIFLSEWDNGNFGKAQTMAFITIAMFQVFSALNSRSRTKSVFTLGLFRNRYLILAVIVSVFLQVLAVHLPVLQTALGVVPLALYDWVKIVAVSSTVFIAVEVRKFIWNRFLMDAKPR